MEKRYSDIVYVVKAFAIICTIAAHMPSTGMTGKLLDIFGTMGAPTFLFISGMFWEECRASDWKKYVNKIVAPWLFGGTVNWLISYIRQYNSLTWIEFFTGKGSYLWYLSVSVGIMFMWGVFSKKCITIIYVLSILRIINVHLEWIPFINTNLYLSLLYWNFWFSSGYLLKKTRKGIPQGIEFMIKYRAFGIIIWIVLFVWYTKSNMVNYFTLMAIPFGFVSIWIMFILAVYIKDNKFLINVGKNTLAIYIWHILIAGFIAARVPNFYMLPLIMPIVTLLLVYGVLKYACLLLNKLNLAWVAKCIFGWKY